MKIEKVITIPIKDGEIEWTIGAYHCVKKCGGHFIKNIHLWSTDKIEEQPVAFFILNAIKDLI